MNKDLPKTMSTKNPINRRDWRFEEVRYHLYEMQAAEEKQIRYRVNCPHFFLFFVLEGRMNIQVGENERRFISKGEFLCTYHDQGNYQLTVQPGRQQVFTLVYHLPILIDKNKEDLLFPSIEPVLSALLNNEPGITSLPVVKMRAKTKRLVQYLQALPPTDHKVQSSPFLPLVLQIARQYHERVCEVYQNPVLSLASQLKIYIDSNLDHQELNLKMLASQFAGSAKTLQRKFQEVYGCSIKQYIIQRRMEKAMALLKEKTALSQVLPQIGYNDTHSFAVQFKQYHGFPPSAV